MKKVILALAAAATIALSTLAPNTAEARCRGGCAVGLGVLGAAAVIGTAAAIANAPYAYPQTYYPVAGYEPYPVYAAPAPYGCPGGYWARRPLRDPYGNVVGWTRPRFFCPAG